MIKSIEYKGFFARGCELEGDRRDDGFTPGQGNVLQLSENLFMVAFSVRGIRGIDDDTSVVYQLRKGSPLGEIVREGHFAKTTNEWDPQGVGDKLVKQHGCVTLMGVPKGALINGATPRHANVFKAMWRITARWLNPETGVVEIGASNPECKKYEAANQAVEYVHFKLNDAEDDVEFSHEPRRLSQVDFERSPNVCVHEGTEHINRSFVNPIPIDDNCERWADMIHFSSGTVPFAEHGHGRVCVIKHRYNPETGLYDWTESGPVLPDGRLFEASIAKHHQGGYMIASRVRSEKKGNGYQRYRAWCHVMDPFNPNTPVLVEDWGSNVPLTSYRCADGTTRFLTGNESVSPYGAGRNPIYCWEIDKRGRLSDRRVVIDPVVEGVLPGESPTNLCVDFAKVLPHLGGNKQWVIFRMKTFNLMFPPEEKMTNEQLDICGLHYSEITYDDHYPAAWTFSN